MTAAETTPRYRDLADFARRAIEFGLLAPAAVVVWADEIIAAEDSPPLWAIELSLAPADAHEMIVRLRQVPGTLGDTLPTYLFLALLRREWNRGQLTIGKVCDIGWQLHSENTIPHPAGQACWGVVLSCECEVLDDGLCSEGDVRASIAEMLNPYAEYEHLLPAWA